MCDLLIQLYKFSVCDIWCVQNTGYVCVLHSFYLSSLLCDAVVASEIKLKDELRRQSVVDSVLNARSSNA